MSGRHAVVRRVVAEARIRGDVVDRTTPAPVNVGPKIAVLRGIGNRENASRGAPDSVYSMYDSPAALTTL